TRRPLRRHPRSFAALRLGPLARRPRRTPPVGRAVPPLGRAAAPHTAPAPRGVSPAPLPAERLPLGPEDRHPDVVLEDAVLVDRPPKAAFLDDAGLAVHVLGSLVAGIGHEPDPLEAELAEAEIEDRVDRIG